MSNQPQQIDPIAIVNNLQIQMNDELTTIKHLFQQLLTQKQPVGTAQPQKNGSIVEFDAHQKGNV